MLFRSIGHVQLDARGLGDELRIAQRLGERLAHQLDALRRYPGREYIGPSELGAGKYEMHELPLLRLLGPNGPQLVNTRQFLNVVIVDQLLARAELRVGIGERAETVTITRGALRTIACPGDEACPVWPEAAATLARKQP